MIMYLFIYLFFLFFFPGPQCKDFHWRLWLSLTSATYPSVGYSHLTSFPKHGQQ